MPSPYDEVRAPFLDAVALIRAQQHRDGTAVEGILHSADTDLPALACVLAQMVATAARTSTSVGLDGFLTMRVDKTIEAADDDEAAGEGP